MLGCSSERNADSNRERRKEKELMGILKKELYRYIVETKTDELLQACKDYNTLLGEKITASGDTLLHKIVSDGKEDMVEQLDSYITPQQLEDTNIRGNNVVHIAALVGSVRMYTLFTKKAPQLMTSRNNDGETPLFMAVLYGRKEAFLLLHQQSCGGAAEWGYEPCLCRKKNGDSILHCAIACDYFELALMIISQHSELVSYVNEKGISPLHLLASRPSVFKRPSHYGWTSSLVYFCINVPPWEGVSYIDDTKDVSQKSLFLQRIKSAICSRGITCGWKKELPRNVKKMPTEYQGNTMTTEQIINVEVSPEQKVSPKGGSISEKEDLEAFSSIYASVKNKLFGEFANIKEEKVKHIYAAQVLKEFAEISGSYEYDANGGQPLKYQGICWAGPASITKKRKKKDNFALAAKFLKDLVKIIAAHESNETGEKVTPPDSEEEEEEEEEVDDDDAKNASQPLKSSLKETWSGESDPSKIKIEPASLELDMDNVKDIRRQRTPILIAAQNGNKEVVKKIIEHIPMAINDMDSNGNNVVLLAARNRQIDVFKYLLKNFDPDDAIFHKVDDKGNTALHNAAMLTKYSDELNPTSTSIMGWEIKWFEYIKKSIPAHLIFRLNKSGKTASDVFTRQHVGLVNEASEEVKKIAEACSVVAALVATVAFATSATIPGGTNDAKLGAPILEHQTGFIVFALSSLVALCTSLTSLLSFLSILNTRPSERDFGNNLPRKILLGMVSLLVSLAMIVISYCSSHFFLLRSELPIDAPPIYIVLGVAITIFTGIQFVKSFDFFKYPRSRVPSDAN